MGIIVPFRDRQKENSSEIPALGIYRSVKLFLQPIKWLEMSTIMRSCNYKCIVKPDFSSFRISTVVFPKFSDRQDWPNSADPDQTSPRGAV